MTFFDEMFYETNSKNNKIITSIIPYYLSDGQTNMLFPFICINEPNYKQDVQLVIKQLDYFQNLFMIG